MNYREYGRTGVAISEVSFGAWAIGGTWGEVTDADAMAALHAAIDAGVNFIDTADVYGDGRSERFVARLKRERSDPVFVATKAGRRLNPHVAEGYTLENLEAFVDRSRTNLEMDTLDLVQLHCPPTDCYYDAAVFEAMESLVTKGKIRFWGVSVARVEEALKAIEHPSCQSVQIIFNAFRQRPAELFFEQAMKRKVGILARLPLSSGMLTGKMTRESKFEPDDHRAANRDGAWFDKGETFSGIPFEVGLEAVEEIRRLLPEGTTMTDFALRWILSFDAVTAAIPGGRRASQVTENCASSGKVPLSKETLEKVKELYNQLLIQHVHTSW